MLTDAQEVTPGVLLPRPLLHAQRGLHLCDGAQDLYPGVQNPGAPATKEAIEGATGLQINYWVLVDLKGFESLVDAVGGITMDVYRRVPIGGGSRRSPATSSRASTSTSTVVKHSGSPAPGQTRPTTTAWRGRNA